jgi:hypothetical protein
MALGIVRVRPGCVVPEAWQRRLPATEAPAAA